MARTANAYPTQKVTAAGLAGAVSILVVWGLSQFANIDISPEVASAFTTLLAFLAGYLTPHARRRDRVLSVSASTATHTDQSANAV
jgi:hypothetical protein